jgi:hypothetical protein
MANPRFTRLLAVNRMLAAAGEQPVSSLAEDNINDTTIAEQVLDATTSEFLKDTLYTNTEMLVYEPDQNGYIYLPEGTLRVDGIYSTDEVTQRGYAPCRLYDLKNNTYVFTDSITLFVTYSVPIQDLPIDVQFAIVDRAARYYSALVTGDTATLGQMLAEQDMRSTAGLKAAMAQQGEYNLFKNPDSNAYWAVLRVRKPKFSGRLSDYD